MTIKQTIEMLEKFKDKSLTLYFDCRHCNKAINLVEAKECVIMRTEE